MPATTHSPPHRYAAAAASVALAALARWLLDPALGDHLPFFTFFIALLVTAWYGGFGPSLVVVLLSTVAGRYLFIPPRGRLSVPHPPDHLIVGFFLAGGLAFALFSGALAAARRRAEASEARYRRIVEAAHEGVWVIDADNRTTFANARMAEVLGCTVEDMLGRSAFVFLFPEDRPEGERLVGQRRKGVREELDLRYRRRDGGEVWLRVSASPLFDEAGRYAGSLGLFTDITQRRRAERELREQREWFEVTLSSVGDAVIATDMHGRVRFLNPAAHALTGWSPAEAAGQPVDAVFNIVNEDTRRPVESPVVKALREGTAVGLANHTILVARDGTQRPIDDSAAPIRDGGGIVGVVLVFRDATKQRATEASLREDERRLRVFVEQTPAAVAMLDKDMRYLSCSRRWLADFGLGDQDLRGRSHYEVFPGLPDRWVEVHRRCLAGAVERAEEDSFTRPDGRAEWVRWEVRPWRDDRGEVGGIILYSEVITERKRAQQAAQEQAGVLGGILAATVDHIYVVDRQGRYTHVSAGGARVLGFEPHRLTGKHWRELGLPAEVMGRFDAQRDRALRSGAPAVEEVAFRTPDGGERHFEYVVAPIAGPDGRAEAVVVVSRDVTERKGAQDRLRASEAKFRALYEMNFLGVAFWDAGGGVPEANDALCRMFGYTPEEFRAGAFNWREGTPPEYRAADERALAEMEGGASHYTPFEKEFYRRDGTRIPVLLGGALLPGHRDRGFSFVVDLSARRRAEDELRATAERLRLALAAARLGDWSWDVQTDAVTLSERAADIFGVPPGPHMTWTAMQGLLHEEDRVRARRQVEAAVAGRTQYDIAYRVNRADGSQVWVAASGRTHCAPSGEPLGMYGVVRDITARKEAEEALRESEERFRAAVGQAAVGVALVGPDGRTLFVNRGLCEMLGYTEAELLAGSFADVTHPDDLPLDYAQMPRLLSGEVTTCRYEKRYLRKGGSVVWADLSVAAVRGGQGELKYAVGVAVDITARKRAEQDARFLADASATLAGLVDYESTLQKVARLAVPHFADWAAVDVLDEGGALRRLAVAHADPAKVALAHDLHRRFPPDPAAPQGVWNVIRTGTPELLSDITDDLLAASVKDADLLRITRELGLRSYMGVPLSVRGRVLGAVTFVAAESGRRYDARDLAVAEDLAHRAAVAIENARLYQEVREADRKKDEFLAVLGHELRNPLAPISNALHVLKLPGANGRVVEQAREMMERQVQHMVRLVDDLLDVSRIVRGKVDLRREPVELAAVVARAVETSQPLIEAEGHELVATLPPEPLRVSGDLVRLAQVVGNLLNNAARYTDRGGRVWVEAERVGHTAVIRVRDTGIGIAPDVLPRVWDMFVQADRRTKGSQGGMGIGLALVKGLVELHGGAVAARSDGPGKGSEFVVTLPLLAAGRPDGGPEPEAGRGARGPARRVLVVDDNADAADSLALLLRLGGHDVRVAHDGPTALALAEADPPEVAFLDLGMPGMDGYEVARRVRSAPALRGMALVALTGWGQKEDRRRTREAGFDAHEVKPVSPEALDHLLATLGRSGGPGSPAAER